ncbi:MAG: helix-turn-helix domain-containing protein, partial [Pseudomonadota bacterium]
RCLRRLAQLLWMGLEALSRIRTAFVPLGETPEAPATATVKDWPALGEELKARLVDEQWHLEPRLTLGDLAERTATNETYVSRALNLGLGVNFNRLVNDARIDTAKQLMVDQPDARLLDIAHRAGFNSKATFNRVFRATCAATPSAWRRSTLDQQTSQIQ